MTNKEDAFWNGEISRSTVAWKSKAFNIIYKSDTYWGKFFDVGLLIVILLSILVVMLDSIPMVREGYGNLFNHPRVGLHWPIYHRILVANYNYKKAQKIHFQFSGRH
jgi:hypothetical protein